MEQLRLQVAQMESFISLVKKGITFVSATVVAQTIGVVWWAATLSANVVTLSATVGGLQNKTEALMSMKRLDERVDEDRQRMQMLEARVTANRTALDAATAAAAVATAAAAASASAAVRRSR